MPYKELSDSTLMSMTKKEIIEQLRCAEHNYRSCEAQVAQQYKNTKDWMPVKHGHWTGLQHSAFHGLDEYGEPIYRDCVTYTHRKCGFNSVIKHNYCPRCGAKMDEVSE